MSILSRAISSVCVYQSIFIKFTSWGLMWPQREWQQRGYNFWDCVIDNSNWTMIPISSLWNSHDINIYIYIYLSLNILSNGYIYLPSCEHWFVDKWLPQVRWLVLQYNFRLQHEIDHHGKMTVLDICSCLLVAMKMSWPRKRRSQFNPMALVDSTQLVSSLLELETLLNSWQRKPSFSTNHIEIWFALSVIWRTKYSNKPLGCR